MPNDDKKWDFVESALTKRNQDLQTSVNPVAPDITSHAGGSAPKGIVESWKVATIERRERIEMLTEKTKGKLAVWKHFVEGQVVVAKQRIDASVEAQLMEIGRQHLASLQDIGISNFLDRQRALGELTRKTTDQLQQVNAMDVPPTMKQKLIDAVTRGWEQLFEKIQSEEIRSTKEIGK